MSKTPRIHRTWRKSIVAFIAAFIVLASLIGSWTYYLNRRTNPFPNPSQIAEVVIPIEPPLKADKSVSFIRVPESEFAALHALFQNSRIDNEPAKWVMFYPMHIILKNGSEMKVTVFLTNEDPGAFRINRTYYRSGTNKAFEEFLRRILPEGVELMME